jgi:tripartite motif-containing protein 71
MGRGELIERLRVVWAFALLIAVCASTPVLAETPEAPQAPATESPQAVAEREASEYAYVNLSPAQEEDLLREHFAPQLEAIAGDPARALDDVVINRIDSPTEALVTVEGEKVLLESEVPLRAPEEDGDLHKVELELEATASGFEPANPLVDLTLPDSADGPIEVGDQGLKITPLGTTDAPASPLGAEDLFLPAASEDTSFLLSPIAGGVELSALLASRNSPQQLAFEVGLPDGATLRADGTGGAEAIDAQGESIATITAPYAIDAQGSEVPVALTVEGSTMTLSVAHRELDVAYPLFVDPQIIEESFVDGSKFGFWKWSWGGVGPEDFIGRTSCIVTCWTGNGLYVRARSNFAYPAGSWGRFGFTPQGSTTFIRRVVLGPINYDTHGCWANEPHAYVGVWNDYSGWSVLANAYPSGWGSYIDTGSQNLGPGTRTVFMGMHSNATTSLACGRDYRLGGATLFLDDPENPVVGAPWGHPSGWIKDGANITINGPVHDPGLGVKRGKLHLGGSVTLVREHGCTGHYANPCWPNHTFSFAVGADSLDEGEKNLEFSAEDILGKPSNTYAWPVKVDRTPPEIDLAGQLAQATDEAGKDAEDTVDQALSLPVYNLQINATDGKNPAEGAIAPGEKRSGVKKIEVFLNDRTTPEGTWSASSCSSGNCPLSKGFTLKLNELSAGTEHTLRVLARDFAGNAPRERKIEFEYIPATGMKEEYVMQYFPLPDGSGNEEEEEHPRRPELAVNLVNGNLVYRQTDIEVETASADLEVELFYNSLLPESQNTEWGDGWTMAEEPALEIEAGSPGAPTEATIVEESGAVESSVDLPTAVGASSFDKRIQASVTKEPDGGFEVSDESGESGDSLEFSPSGRLEEIENGTSATVDYDYEDGDLAEISIEDPGTANVAPGSLDEDAAYPRLAIGHSANFGVTGTADGQLKSPADVVADGKGNVWVLDRGNGRIQKFGPGGEFVAKFGTAGSQNGQFNSPNALAIDASGNFLVVDNHRVQKFGPGGQFLSRFGFAGVSDGQFWLPNGIASGSDGSIWVSDAFGVQRFNAAGAFVERVGAAGGGAISEPQGLDVGPGGDVFVADAGNDRISVFDAAGDYVRSFGSTGTGPGQFSSIAEVDVDADGNVWVADAEADRVQLFNSAGEHIASFGAPGTGAQQFRFEAWAGIASDGQGRVWIVDAGNDRLGRWVAAPFTGFFRSAGMGGTGSADGQLKSPADVAADPEGNLWVLDRGNGRVQRFGSDGQFLAKFGTPGGEEGQLNSPSALALDAAGNVLLAENHRVQKFSASGQFLGRFGWLGVEPGQFWLPNGIAVGADGSVWVSDANFVQRFTAGGQFIERVGTSGPGQISQPQSLDVDAVGNVFVADAGNDRISVFDQEGDYLRQFGSAGSGPGQFQSPTEVEVDSDGKVWVADSDAERIQVFTAFGDRIAGFGSAGNGAEQFKLEAWTGIAADGHGRVWVADAGNDRVAEWLGGNYEASSAPIPTEDDPQLEIDVSEGLVDTVEGEEAGTVDYDHSGDLLTSVEGPETGADFEYDEKERLSKVTLANGTYAVIAYEPTYNRVKSVTVAPQGANAKTTYFNYSDDPRSTLVMPPDGMNTTYDFAADGSVFKWRSASQPPVFDDIGGTLYDPANRETSEAIAPGPHTLKVQAHSDQGIASIQVVANNNQLVDEKTCTFDPAQPNACNTVPSEWVTETGNWPPGILHLEVIATDRAGRSVSQRFWVNIPYTPPPDPEAEEPPRFGEVLRFREEFGLDLDLKGDESAIYDRVFDLIGAWHNPTTPAGEVAHASVERWGAPLRPVDVAELEYRDFYIPHDTAVIRQWGEQQVPGSYAGYYVDNRAGGIIYVALVGDETERSNLLSSVASALRAPLRFKPASGSFVRTLTQLRAIERAAVAEVLSHPELDGQFGGAHIDVPKNHVIISVLNPSKVGPVLAPNFDTALKVDQGNAPLPPPAKFSRYNNRGPVQAGDLLLNGGECTAGFGAWDIREGKTKSTGDNIYIALQLTAGHCWKKGLNVWRGEPGDLLGKVTRNNYRQNGVMTLDAATINTTWSELGRSIYINRNREKGVKGYATPVVGQSVCLSGERTNKLLGKQKSMRVCGPVLDEPREYLLPLENGGVIRKVEVPVGARVSPGDSGGPAWIMGTGQAAGLITGAYDEEYGHGSCTDLLGGEFGDEDQGEYICPIVGLTTVQQIVTGAQSLYNAEKLSSEGVAIAEPLYIGGLAVQK